MTTLVERRAWLREGCPVEEPEYNPDHLPLSAPGKWEGFALSVNRWLDGDGGELHGHCLGCGVSERWTGLEKTKAPITGVLKQVKAAQEWMVNHTVEKHGLRGRIILAREIFGQGRTHLWIWAAQIMSAGKSINGGWVTARGSPHSGIHLRGDPSKWADPIPALRDRVKKNAVI